MFGVLFYIHNRLYSAFFLENLDYSDVLIVQELGCGSWLAREYMPAHQQCGLFYPLGWGLEGSPLSKGRSLVLRSGTVFWVLSGQSGVHHPPSPVNRLGLQNQRKTERKILPPWLAHEEAPGT